MSINIFVATPSYKNSVSAYYAASLLDYTNTPGMRFRFETLSGDSLVTRARNAMFSQYFFEYQSKGYTHLFWQDDDIFIAGQNLLRLAESGLDVSGIAVPLKTNDISRGIPCAVNGVYEQVEPMLYKTRHLGTGAMLLSNKAVEAIANYCWDNGFVYYDTNRNYEIYDAFQTGVKGGMHLSEDWFLCNMLTELGFDIHVDSSGTCLHADFPGLWSREPMEVDPRVFSENFRDPLPEQDRGRFWTPNDYRNPVSA